MSLTDHFLSNTDSNHFVLLYRFDFAILHSFSSLIAKKYYASQTTLLKFVLNFCNIQILHHLVLESASITIWIIKLYLKIPCQRLSQQHRRWRYYTIADTVKTNVNTSICTTVALTYQIPNTKIDLSVAEIGYIDSVHIIIKYHSPYYMSYLYFRSEAIINQWYDAISVTDICAVWDHKCIIPP